MKKLMKSKLTIFLFVLMFLSVQCSYALNTTADSSIDNIKGDVKKMESVDTSKDVNVTVLESDLNRTIVKFDINNFEKSTVNIDGKDYYNIKCDDTTLVLNEGAPELPQINKNIIIPNGAKVKVNVIASEYEDIKHFPVAPSKGSITRDKDPKDVPYTFGKAYKNGHMYPSELVTLSEPFIMRELRGTTIKLNAFQYKPSNQTLRVYKSVTVEVVAEGISEINSITTTKSSAITKDFEPAYANTFINYENTQSQIKSIMNNPSETGSMLIICYDSYASAMDSFITWKNSKGINTTLVNRSTVSSSNNPTEIKSYIQNYYDQNPDLTYVLLVGDYAQVSSPTYSDGVSDPEYTKVAGSDNYPDIYVGRFSAQSIADVQTQVERTLDFEQNGHNTASWFKKAIGIASDEGSGETDIDHMNIIKNNLLNDDYTLVDSVYDPGASASTITNSLNSGRGLINYVGHGAETYWVTSGFSNTNIQNLQNADNLPFIISVSCVSGKFQSGTCFAEAWLRSEDSSGNPVGAIGALMSTVNQPWVPPMVGQDGIMDLLVNDQRISLGGLCYSGQTSMIDNGGSDYILTFHTWTLFGDPSIQILPSTGTTPTDNYEPNETLAQAYTIDNGVDYDSYVFSSGDVDYYKLTATDSGSINASLSNLPLDYDLYLYNSSGTELAKSTNGSTTTESISYAVSAGTYYLKVIGYNNVYSQSTKYKLNATYPTGSGGTMQWYYESQTYDSPHNYTNDYNGINEYVKTGATKVQVHFSRFETESNYDYVYIKDNTGATVATYDGTLSPFWATVDGDKITINLVSDYSITKYGYTIDQVAYYANGQLVTLDVDIHGGNL